MQLNTVLCVVAKYVDRELVLKIDEERYFLLHRYVIIFFLNIHIYLIVVGESRELEKMNPIE